MKRKHLLFKEAVCKNRISLIKLFANRNCVFQLWHCVFFWARKSPLPQVRKRPYAYDLTNTQGLKITEENMLPL